MQNCTFPSGPSKECSEPQYLYFYPCLESRIIFVSVLFSDTTVVNTLYLGLGEYVDNLVVR